MITKLIYSDYLKIKDTFTEDEIKETTLIEQNIENITFETNNNKITIEVKPKTTTKKKVTKKK